MTVLIVALAGCSALTNTPVTSSSPTPVPVGASPNPTPTSSSAPAGVVDLQTFGFTFSNNVNANYSRDPVTDPTVTASTGLSSGKWNTLIILSKTILSPSSFRQLFFMSKDLAPPTQGRTYALGKSYALGDATSTAFLQLQENTYSNWISEGGGTLRVTSLSGDQVSIAIEGAKMVGLHLGSLNASGSFTIDGTASVTMHGL